MAARFQWRPNDSNVQRCVVDRPAPARLHGHMGRVQRPARIGPGGNARLRRVIYLAAVVTGRFNPPLKAYYERLRTAGKPVKVARCAGDRKLLHQGWAVVTKQQPFDPAISSQRAPRRHKAGSRAAPPSPCDCRWSRQPVTLRNNMLGEWAPAQRRACCCAAGCVCPGLLLHGTPRTSIRTKSLLDHQYRIFHDLRAHLAFTNQGRLGTKTDEQ